MTGSGAFRVYRVQKRKRTSIEAAAQLASLAGVSAGDVAMAGLKDRQGATEQTMTIERGRPVSHRRPELGIETIGSSDRAISSAETLGNHFDIVVRDLGDLEVRHAHRALDVVREHGLPNYFDEQRFGNLKHGQGWLVLDLIHGRHEMALKSLLTKVSPSDDGHTKRFKSGLYRHWGDWSACRDVAGRFGSHHSLFEHLKRTVDDFAGAFRFIPTRIRLIHLYAYQSHLWNRAVAAFLQQRLDRKDTLGLRSIEGRLVFPKGPLPAPPEWGGTFPLVGPGLDGVRHEDQRALYVELLAKDGLKPEQLRIDDVPGFQLKAEERALTVVPRELRVRPAESDTENKGRSALKMSFGLPGGAYATLVVRRLIGASARSEESYGARGRTRSGDPARGRGGYTGGRGGYRGNRSGTDRRRGFREGGDDRGRGESRSGTDRRHGGGYRDGGDDPGRGAYRGGADGRRGGGYRKDNDHRGRDDHRGGDGARSGTDVRREGAYRGGGEGRGGAGVWSGSGGRRGGGYRDGGDGRARGGDRSGTDRRRGGGYRDGGEDRGRGGARSGTDRRGGGTREGRDHRGGGRTREGRDERGGGGYREGRNDRGGGGYREGRNDRGGGGYREGRNDRGGGGYREGRNDRGGGGYRGGRNDRGGGGYRGGRDDRGGGGYRGGRDDRGGGGYRGGRNDRSGGGYREGRDDRSGGGYREGRDDRGGGGYREGRDDRGGGGYRGGRSGGVRGYRGGAGGQRRGGYRGAGDEGGRGGGYRAGGGRGRQGGYRGARDGDDRRGRGDVQRGPHRGSGPNPTKKRELDRGDRDGKKGQDEQ